MSPPAQGTGNGTSPSPSTPSAPSAATSAAAQKARTPSSTLQPRKSLGPSQPSPSPRTRKVSAAAIPPPPQAKRAGAGASAPAANGDARRAVSGSRPSAASSNRVVSRTVPKEPPSEPAADAVATPPNDEAYDITQRVGFEPRGLQDPASKQKEAIVWLDIDNTLYKRSTRIAELMGERIREYIVGMGLGEEEAKELHLRYYKTYGLAVRGLVRHHNIDPLDYDRKCDASLPLDNILRPDPAVIRLLSDLDRTKVRVFALTNAYKQHADRVLRLLQLDDQVEGIVFCDYAVPEFSCKPELEFYQAAMKLVDARPGTRCYFVDDSALNIAAAKELGWHSCVFFAEADDEDELAAKAAADPTADDVQAAQDFDVSVLAPRSNGVARQSYFDEEAIKAQFQKLPSHMRIRLLSIILDACLPGDIATMARTLERHLRSTRDLVSGLPDTVALKVFEKLPIQDLLRCRQVSKKWHSLAATPELWRSHALALTENDPVKVQPPAEPEGWETLVKGLFFRERNWAKGIAQRIDLFEGHTGFVTSMKLKGKKTLVTGSYDETIRVWDLSTGACKKVLKAKAIACLDFLLDEGIICAGLYDTGRVMVWDMRTGEVLQTLSGHNRGIRNVALNSDYLVSVGQDKAIVVWDWKAGTKIVRFGQQSNVSLGVSLVDRDKLVAVTVDGVIRCFSIRRKEMIGQFHLTKLGEPSIALGSRLGDLASGSTMLEWFAAHGNTMTVASKNLVVHLEWQEHVVPVVEEELVSPTAASGVDGLRRSASSRLGIHSLTTTPVHSRTRRDSTQSNASVSSPATGNVRSPLRSAGAQTPIRSRKDSTASNASVASNATAGSSARRSVSHGTPLVPSGVSNGAVGGAGSSSGITRSPSLSTPSRPSPRSNANFGGRKLGAPTPWPLAGAASQLDSPASSPVAFPSSRSEAARSPTSASGNTNGAATRIAPNLGVAPRVTSILETPDMATGCVDPSKRRIVCSSRFSSRAGADRRLYTSSLAMDLGKTSLQLDVGGAAAAAAAAAAVAPADDNELAEAGHKVTVEEGATISPIAGAWAARAADLQVPSRNPMAMVLDHESVVVGCQDGTVYRVGMVGSEYGLVDPSLAEAEHGEDSVGDATIATLDQLREVWKEVFLPPDAPADHPGRLKRDLVKSLGFK